MGGRDIYISTLNPIKSRKRERGQTKDPVERWFLPFLHVPQPLKVVDYMYDDMILLFLYIVSSTVNKMPFNKINTHRIELLALNFSLDVNHLLHCYTYNKIIKKKCLLRLHTRVLRLCKNSSHCGAHVLPVVKS